ncbi:hypothetical protein HHI36_003553 [Cryptolaemus montrouzieri]|uniref:RING-type domain-containing protein n=1 Tax=Cryptolaemus montrouzieri TaxID=559131 RepID=A0ABD2PDP3_9CUCU
MEINCIICSDLFCQSSEIVVNQCGHIFHHTCLLQWIERSKTCPQCRTRATEKSIYKVFFNFLNTDHIVDNVGTLQAKLDGANFKLKLNQKEIKELIVKCDLREAQNIELRELVSELESKIRSLESGVNGLKEQVSFYRNKAKETERLQSEVMTLKSSLRDVEKVQTAIHGTRSEVTEILRNETSIEALALLSATLKKTLIDLEQKNTILLSKVRHTQNDTSKYKRECRTLETTNAELKQNLSDSKKIWDEEKRYLKQKIEELNERLNERKDKSPKPMDSSLQRILTESPAPLPRRRVKLESDGLEMKGSPTVEETVMNIMDSDSPYLQTKPSYGSIFGAKYTTKIGQKKSIFKTTPQEVVPSKPTTSHTVYTGLGGQVNEDYFKFPVKKSSPVGLKRHKSSSSVSTTKFRKLTALPSTKKITDFITAD